MLSPIATITFASTSLLQRVAYPLSNGLQRTCIIGSMAESLSCPQCQLPYTPKSVVPAPSLAGIVEQLEAAHAIFEPYQKKSLVRGRKIVENSSEDESVTTTLPRPRKLARGVNPSLRDLLHAGLLKSGDEVLWMGNRARLESTGSLRTGRGSTTFPSLEAWFEHVTSDIDFTEAATLDPWLLVSIDGRELNELRHVWIKRSKAEVSRTLSEKVAEPSSPPRRTRSFNAFFDAPLMRPVSFACAVCNRTFRHRKLLCDGCGGTCRSTTASASRSSSTLPAGPCLVLPTALSHSDKEFLRCRATQFRRLKGVALTFDFNMNVTHVVCSSDSKHLCSRTLKYLMAVVFGKWVVSFDCR